MSILDGRRWRPHGVAAPVLVMVALGMVVSMAASFPPAKASDTASGAAQAASSGSYADRIRIGLVSPYYRPTGPGTPPFPLSNVLIHDADFEAAQVARFLFRALYRYDSVLTPVPDIAAEPCVAGTDGLQVTCHLGTATFSNGDPLTANDVAFTYALAASEVCPFRWDNTCLGDTLAATDVIDPSTVRFTLNTPDPTFESLTLPTLWIDSQRVVDSQYQAFRSAASAVGSDRLRQEGELVDAGLGASAPDCAVLGSEAEPVVLSAGLKPPDKALWDTGPGRTFDACGWTGVLRDMLLGAADSLDNSGLDAEAIAYPILPLNWHPIGSGAWQIDEAASRPGDRLVLTASPFAAHAPATPRIEFVSYPTRRDEAEGLRAGEIDWMRVPADWGGGVEQGGAELDRLVHGFSDVKFAEYVDPTGYMELSFNTRPGQLFADPNLRHALALCMDRRQLVDAAMDGQGIEAASVIAPDVWAADPALTVPPRDVAAARALIEASGWSLTDGTYTRAGRRLSVEIWTAQGRAERVKFANLLAYQARDCGMDVEVRGATGPDISRGICCWPQYPPGETEPFDLVLSFAYGPGDPAPFLVEFESPNMTSAAIPDGADFTGYDNPAFDRLVTEARATYDIGKRARLYREAQDMIAEDAPVLPIWYNLDRVALRSGITSTSGSLDLGKPGWDWQPDRLVLTTPGQ